MRLIVLLLALASSLQAQDDRVRFKVMAWNILHGANDIPKGPERAIEIIEEIDPDVILMVETYGSGPKIAEALGYKFHLIAPPGTPLDDKGTNLSIYSKFPFGQRIDTDFPFYLGGIEIFIYDQRVRFFSNWFHYEPWEDEPEKLGKNPEELLLWERTGKKFEMLQKVIPYFKKYAPEADSIPLIIGGDMNTPSHLDWGEESKEIHNELVVPWYTTRVLEDMGLIDSYRQAYPNPLTHPGITWNAKGKKDEHRIDYIFYKGYQLNLIESKSYQAYLGEPLELNGKKIPYPSDHGFVLSTFDIQLP